MLPQYLQSALSIGVDCPPNSCAVKSTMDTFATEFIGIGAVCIPEGEIDIFDFSST
jgi:hypothetical protein